MILHRYFLLGATIGALAACGSDSTSPKFITPAGAGLVRFINAVPDTGFQDFRFTDVVEGVPNVEFVNMPFRGGTNVAFQRAVAGTHHIRVFMGSSNTMRVKNPANTNLADSIDITNVPSIVSTVMGDTTFTFQQDVAQTFVFYGSARAGAQKFLVTTDARPTLTAASGNLAFRTTNLTAGPVDVYLVPGATLAAAPSGTPVITNLASLGTSSYVTQAVAAATGGYTVFVTDAGALTLVARALMPVGAALVPAVPGVSGQLDPVAGSRISGSVFTGYIFPPSVAGSKAAVFAAPGVGLTIDKNPPAS
jgi:ABC-type multidrug transport system fused ATPase/permease subunit